MTVRNIKDSTEHTPPQKRRPLRHLIGIASILFLGCVFVGTIALSGRLGSLAGTSDFRHRATATGNALLVEWFLRGMNELQQGKYALAEADFIAVLKAQPENINVQRLVTTARIAQTPTSEPPTPTLLPISTPTPIVLDKPKMLIELKIADESRQYDKAIALSDQIRAFDDQFETVLVEDIRFRSLVARGVDRLSNGDLEAGIYDLDIASAIRELDPTVLQQRQMAAMYQNAMNYVGADWDKAIELLNQIYSISPQYRNVGITLRDALERSGDAFASLQEWCPADEHYLKAANLTTSARLAQKQNDSHIKCLSATPIAITGTAVSSYTVQAIPGINGNIVFAAVDPNSGAYQLQKFDINRSQLSTLEVGGSQPAFQPAANMTAYAFGSAIHGLSSNGTIVLLGSSGGAWPSVSPDGTRIVYALFQNGIWNIVIHSFADTTAATTLGQGSHPVWGPTGKIAFQGCDNALCGIYIVDPDQPSSRQRITTSPGDTSVQWSPDGSHIAYMTNFTGNWEIYTVGLANLQFRQITNGTGISAAPSWSADGSHLAFESNRDGSWGIYVVGSQGGEAIKLLAIGTNHPAWQTERTAWTP